MSFFQQSDDQHQMLVLASSSPRRVELLESLGIGFEREAPNIDESLQEGESFEQAVRRLALEKAQAVAKTRSEGFVLAADTTVIVGEELFGKPRDRDHAAEMLHALTGAQHQVLGAIALIDVTQKIERTRISRSDVFITPQFSQFRDRYLASEEWKGKAGAYAIQGIMGSFITDLHGSYSNVVGLDISATIRLLLEAGVLK